MSVVELKTDPTRRDLIVFGVLWVVFFIVLGRLALLGSDGLLVGGIMTGALILFSLVFNREVPRREQLLAVVIPLTLIGVWNAGTFAGGTGDAAPFVRTLLVIDHLSIALIGGAVIFGSKRYGGEAYRIWMRAVLPMGWSISVVLLGAVYYGVFTPIGMAMRAFGYDPMQRAFEPDSASYWCEHERVTDPKRYFRQF